MHIIAAIISAISLTAASLECFRVLQSASYMPWRGYVKVYFSWYGLSLCVVQAAAVLIHCFVPFDIYVNAGIFAFTAVVVNCIPRKCPLRLTKRLWRMLAVECVLLCALCLFVGEWFWPCLLPVATFFAWALCLPVDIAVNRFYLNKAVSRLRQSNVCIIAITGSYGKTSVKDMLSQLLNDCIAPPGSCNTPLGIAAFVNKTDLSGKRYLVLEFGARKKGDITRLCKLYRPFCGVVTGVCAQHLTTFKTLENIIAAKRELVEQLPAEGFCVLNRSDPVVLNYASAGVCSKYPSDAALFVAAGKVDFSGTQLKVEFNGLQTEITVPQIADHVADTFAMCVQLSIRLGQPIDVTLANASKLTQTPHRLQLISGANCHILDDSYNGSIAGVQSCCRTLGKFHCPKAVITQGLVECGRMRKQMNVQCGRMLGAVCDVAVVLGKNSKYIAEGLLQTGCRVLHADNLQQAVGLAAPFAAGGILLFQNDLPDVVGI